MRGKKEAVMRGSEAIDLRRALVPAEDKIGTIVQVVQVGTWRCGRAMVGRTECERSRGKRMCVGLCVEDMARRRGQRQGLPGDCRLTLRASERPVACGSAYVRLRAVAARFEKSRNRGNRGSRDRGYRGSDSSTLYAVWSVEVGPLGGAGRGLMKNLRRLDALE